MKLATGYYLATIVGCIALLPVLVLPAGCGRKPPSPPPKVADLRFPVLVLYPNSLTLLFKDATDLGVMNTNLVISLSQPHCSLIRISRSAPWITCTRRMAGCGSWRIQAE